MLATCLVIALLRLAAWLAWMTPFEVALSSFLVARRRASSAFFLSPAAIAAWVARMAVLSSLLTALLRSCAFLLVPMRLICDLMFAMKCLSFSTWKVGCAGMGGQATERCGSSGQSRCGKQQANQGATLPGSGMRRQSSPAPRVSLNHAVARRPYPL